MQPRPAAPLYYSISLRFICFNDFQQIAKSLHSKLLLSLIPRTSPNHRAASIARSNASSVFNGVGFSGNGVTYSVTPNGNLLGTLSYGHAQGAVGAGSYAITPTGLYSTQQGYSITAISATLTISPLTLTGTVAAGNSVYGAPLTPGAVTFSNLVTGYTAVTSPVTVTTACNLSGGGKLKVGTYAGVESAG